MSMQNKSFTTEDLKFIFNELRKASVIWSGRREILALSRRKTLVRRAKNGNPVYKFMYQCAKCEHWFRNQSDMEVDHIVEIGGTTAYSGDWNEILHRLFPRPVEKHLQVLCVPCHARKTSIYNSARSRYKRKPK